jgi:hypothetical protein
MFYKRKLLIPKYLYFMKKLHNILRTFLKKIKKTARNLFLNPLLLMIIKYNYARKLKSLHGQDKINVAFLVWENAKWNGASLYQKLLSDTCFSTMILIVHKNVSEDKINYDFFKERGYNVFKITYLSDLLIHKPDIVFYQQPWFVLGFRSNFSPLKLSRIALCFYFPYSIANNIELPKIWNMCKFFFRAMYKQFLFNMDCVQEFKVRGVHNAIATGHPVLDVYNEPVKNNPWYDSKRYKVIYAPHHSFSTRSLQWATFAWNGRQLLQMAKDNPHTEWIFKPHPWFKKNIVKIGIMTMQEADQYFSEWAQIGQIYDKGDYFDIFRTSDLMITDSGGFLTQYLPTGNPVIHLIGSNESVRGIVGRKSSQHYYKVHDLIELESTFDMLVNQHKDPLKVERKKDAAEITYNAAENIMNVLLKILRKENT